MNAGSVWRPEERPGGAGDEKGFPSEPVASPGVRQDSRNPDAQALPYHVQRLFATVHAEVGSGLCGKSQCKDMQKVNIKGGRGLALQ